MIRRLGVQSLVSLSVVITACMVCTVRSHGRLVDPPSRSSMWRYGFRNPRNYNDMELFCGGFHRQWVTNHGKCGICGDAWNAPDPKPNEIGGTYASSGIVVRTYDLSLTHDMVASVELTANHKGNFQFRICPYASVDVTTEVSQECLDRHVLELQDGSGTLFQVPAGSGNGVFHVPLRLPSDVSCERCLFQWIYKAANNWGRCDDGSGKVGCGPQEQFRACADISIVAATPTSTVNEENELANRNDFGTYGFTENYHEVMDTDGHHHHHHHHDQTPSTTFVELSSWTTTTTTTSPPLDARPSDLRPFDRDCIAVGVWSGQTGMNNWCRANCNHVPPYCPTSHCICVT